MSKKIYSFLLVLILILCGCNKVSEILPYSDGNTAETVRTYQNKDSLTIFAIRPETLNPLLTDFSINRTMLSLIFEPLFTTTQSFEINPKLAESYTVGENAMSLTVNLRRGIKWHDGSEFTANDVDYTVKHILEMKEEAYCYNSLLNVAGAGVVDRYTFEFTLQNPDSGFVGLLDFPIIKNNSAETLALCGDAVGTGMYKYSGGEVFKNIILERNEGWWGGSINIPAIVAELIPDTDSLYNGFKMNSIDVAVADNASGSKYGINENVKFINSNTNYYTYLALNHRNILLKNGELRKIMYEILSTDKITMDLLPGYSVLCSSPVNPASVYTMPVETTEKPGIKDRLRELGCGMDDQGLRKMEIDGNGYLLDFNLLICSDNPTRIIVGEYIKSSLMMYGISVNIVGKTKGEYISAAYSGNYDMVLCETKLGLNRDFGAVMATGGSVNIGGYSSSATDDALYLLKIARTDTEAAEAFKNIQNIFATDTPHIPLYFSQNKIIYNEAAVENVVAGDIGYEYSNINQWILKN